MPNYVFLVQLTDQGIHTVKDSPKRANDFEHAITAAGGKVTAILHTMGIYDAVAIAELPSDEAANRLALGVGLTGAARTITLKGWTAAEFRQLVEKL
ncbi:MAG: GYD domain-containing protein [Thermoplasmata archaeon]